MKKRVVTMASALPWCALPLSETETVCPEALPRAIEPLSKPREDTNINEQMRTGRTSGQRLLFVVIPDESTIHKVSRTCDVGSLVRGQKDRQGCHIFHRPQAAQRNVLE